MKKIIPVLIALILFVLVGYFAFGQTVMEKYSYSKEVADIDDYFGTVGLAMNGEDGRLAIILQNEMLQKYAYVIGGQVYFDMGLVKELLTDGFYYDEGEALLINTGATQSIETHVGSSSYSDSQGEHALDYPACVKQGETMYLAAEYLKKFANFEYQVFDRHLQLRTEWGVLETMRTDKATQLRLKGGIKSPILEELAEGETVILLEQMETWSKVKTADSLIGYVENKRLTGLSAEVETPVTTVKEEEYLFAEKEGKVCLGWHAIGGVGGNDTLEEMAAEGQGMNVIAPTWFSFTDNEGNYRSFASDSYVNRAHAKGLKVWGVWDDFNYRNETGTDISTYEIFSSTPRRRALVSRMIDTALSVGMDGINLDFEKITADAGPHFVQFLKELSIDCRANGLVLSVDNYMPNAGNTYYRLDVQGKVCDYVVLMGYDEHWHGSKDPGSVASIGFITDGIEKTVSQVDAGKVINAVPFYTILWKTEGAEVSDSYITVNNTADFLTRTGRAPEWDEITCQNYLEWESGSALYQVWLEDEESLKTRLNVMSAHKLGGVAVWRLGYGTPEMWNLLKMYTQME